MMMSSEVRIFRPSDSAERAEYLKWIAAHPSEFVGAFRWDSHHRIHRADCPDVQKPTSDKHKKEAVRVCSLDRQKIEQWAMENNYGGLRPCGNCQRSGRL